MEKMGKENILFKTSSTFQKFANLLIRLFCLSVVIDAAIHFNENRILTSIVITLFFIGFLLVNDKSIIVYSNYIEFNYKCVLPYMLTPIKVYFDDIESIDTKLRFSFGYDFITFISSFIPSVNSFNTLIITQKEKKRVP
jgi:hypothetical protein